MAAARLPAIVKLSGSFAAGGLLYAELHTGAVDGAWLPFLKSLLSPKEAQALSLPYLKIKTAPPPPRMKPWIALDEAGKCVKVYPSELRLQSYWSQFRAFSLAAATCRGLFFTYHQMIDEHFKKIRDSEEEATLVDKEWEYSEDAPSFDYDLAWSKGPAALLAIVREVFVGISRIFLSRMAVEHLDRALAWKLVKDQVSSLRAKRRFPFYRRCYMVPRTYIRSSIITQLAEFVVSTAFATARVLRIWWEGGPVQTRWKELRQFLVVTAIRQLTVMVASAAGAGLIGTVRPGIQCTWAGLAAGFAMEAFVCQPAIHAYQDKNHISTATKVIIFGCLTAVGVCFLPWISLPSLEGLTGQQQCLQLS